MQKILIHQHTIMKPEKTQNKEIVMSERCPYCNSGKVVEIKTTVTSHEYICRSCEKRWEETHVGGQVLKAGGALLSGALAIFLLMGGDDS